MRKSWLRKSYAVVNLCDLLHIVGNSLAYAHRGRRVAQGRAQWILCQGVVVRLCVASDRSPFTVAYLNSVCHAATFFFGNTLSFLIFDLVFCNWLRSPISTRGLVVMTREGGEVSFFFELIESIRLGFRLVRLLLLILDEKVQIACFAASVCLVFHRGWLCDFSLGVVVPRHLK